jgi:phage terminase large subunit-like protein
MEVLLSERNLTKNSSMKESEFLDCMDDLFSINNVNQSKIAFRTALLHSKLNSNTDYVSLEYLAQISSYFYLIQLVNDLPENLNDIFKEQRKVNIENEIKIGIEIKKKCNLTDIDEVYIKISDINKYYKILRKYFITSSDLKKK